LIAPVTIQPNTAATLIFGCGILTPVPLYIG